VPVHRRPSCRLLRRREIADGIGYEFNVFVYLFISLFIGPRRGRRGRFIIGLPGAAFCGSTTSVVTLGLVFAPVRSAKLDDVHRGNEGSPMPIKADISRIA